VNHAKFAPVIAYIKSLNILTNTQLAKFESNFNPGLLHDWINLAQYTIQWRVVNTATLHRVR